MLSDFDVVGLRFSKNKFSFGVVDIGFKSMMYFQLWSKQGFGITYQIC